MERKPLSKKIRFEVFKRDNFKCQYCGKSAPEVILHVDHIIPVAEGGTNEIYNLTTACQDCNLGKGARKLNDNTVLLKQSHALEEESKHLEELHDRQEQLQMLIEWREQLNKVNIAEFAYIAEIIESRIGRLMTMEQRNTLKKVVKKFPIQLVADSAEKSLNQYIKTNKDGEIIPESIEKVVNMVGRICGFTEQMKDKPYLKELAYIRGILKKRFDMYEKFNTVQILEAIYNNGMAIETIKEHALIQRNWTEFCNATNFNSYRNKKGNRPGVAYGK